MGRTREVTLYRLVDVEPTREGLRLAIDQDQVGPDDIHDVDVAGSPGVWVERVVSRDEAAWCADAARTTGRQVSLEEHKPSGLLVIAVDGEVYGVGYAYGHRLLVDDFKDTRFGLSVAIRTLDEHVIQDLSRRGLGGHGRTDMTSAPAGLPIWGFDLERQIDIVRKVAGETAALQISFSGDEARPVRLKGSAGLRLHLGVEPADFVNDIIEIARVRRSVLRSCLEFVEWIPPVPDRHRIVELDNRLDEILGRPQSQATRRVIGVVPANQVGNSECADSFDIKVGTTTMKASNPRSFGSNYVSGLLPSPLSVESPPCSRAQLPSTGTTAHHPDQEPSSGSRPTFQSGRSGSHWSRASGTRSAKSTHRTFTTRY